MLNNFIAKQESPPNAKGNAWQQCMFEDLLRSKSKLTSPSSWHSTRWLRRL